VLSHSVNKVTIFLASDAVLPVYSGINGISDLTWLILSAAVIATVVMVFRISTT